MPRNPTGEISLAKLAKKYGSSESTLKRYKNDGVDVFNEEEFRKHQELQDICPANLTTGLPDDIKVLRKEKLKYDTGISRERERLNKLQADKVEGQLVDIDEVNASMVRIATTVKSQLKAMEVFLPSKLQGLTSKQMAKVIQESNKEILEYLYNEFKIEDN